MTERLYYVDSYLRSFRAQVVEAAAGGLTVYLDRTAFYPASGGQPSDTGSIAGSVVLEVVDEGERIAHRLSSPLAAGAADCAIDWERRFDHMQQLEIRTASSKAGRSNPAPCSKPSAAPMRWFSRTARWRWSSRTGRRPAACANPPSARARCASSASRAWTAAPAEAPTCVRPGRSALFSSARSRKFARPPASSLFVAAAPSAVRVRTSKRSPIPRSFSPCRSTTYPRPPRRTSKPAAPPIKSAASSKRNWRLFRAGNSTPPPPRARTVCAVTPGVWNAEALRNCAIAARRRSVCAECTDRCEEHNRYDDPDDQQIRLPSGVRRAGCD